MMILRNMLLVAVALVSAALLAASQEADGILRADLQGRGPKKSRNLIAVLCCFCGWIDFGVCAVSGWGCGQRGRCPSRFYGGTELQNLFLHCEPKKYKLFQVADLVCTLKLLEVKLPSDMGLSPC